MTIKRIDVGDRMSQAVIHNDIVFTAGQVAKTKGGESYGEQTQEILDQIDALLAKAGTDKSKLIRATIWITDMSRFDEMNVVVGRMGVTRQRTCPGLRRIQTRIPQNSMSRSWLRPLSDKPSIKDKAMKALVLGAGIAGITTAYELNKDGYDVTVIDREEQPASFTSYGNAGLFAPGHAYSWASPASPGILLRSLWRDDQALRFRPNFDPAFWRWMWQFWRECSAERSAASTTRKARLCNYSLDVFHETVKRTEVKYDGRDGGLLYLFRTPAKFEAAIKKSQILIDVGIEVDTLDRDGIVAADPVLEPAVGKLTGCSVHAQG